MEVRNLDSGKVTVFPFNRWLSRTRGEKQLSQECSAYRGGRKVLDTATYTILVRTSSRRGAGTNANVSVKIFGEFLVFKLKKN